MPDATGEDPSIHRYSADPSVQWTLPMVSGDPASASVTRRLLPPVPAGSTMVADSVALSGDAKEKASGTVPSPGQEIVSPAPLMVQGTLPFGERSSTEDRDTCPIRFRANVNWVREGERAAMPVPAP